MLQPCLDLLRTARVLKARVDLVESMLQHFTDLAMTLLEKLDHFAQNYPAEILDRCRVIRCVLCILS